MVLRVKPTPIRFPANSLYTPLGNTALHSIPSVCRRWRNTRWPKTPQNRMPLAPLFIYSYGP